MIGWAAREEEGLQALEVRFVTLGVRVAHLRAFRPSPSLAALVVGYLALLLVERLVVKGRFQRFAPYTACLAALCFYLQYRG